MVTAGTTRGAQMVAMHQAQSKLKLRWTNERASGLETNEQTLRERDMRACGQKIIKQ